MSSSDRRPYLTASNLTQELLDYSFDNLENELQLIVDIEVDQRFSKRTDCGFIIISDLVDAADHSLVNNDKVIFETTGTLPSGINANVEYYVINANSNTFQISLTLGGIAVSLSDVGTGLHKCSESPAKIRISDRNIFVGNRFYEARTNFPTISRTVGEWLSPSVEFSSFSISINNTDGKYNSILPGGDYFSGQVNKEINVRLGLRDLESTYFSIFKGYVTHIGGFKRDTKTINFIARDYFDRLNRTFPNNVFSKIEFPKLKEDLVGSYKPIIYGDFTSNVNTEGNLPSIVVNGADPQLQKEEVPLSLSISSPCVVTQELHLLDTNDKIRLTTDGLLPTGLSINTDYYVKLIDENTYELSASAGGPSINTSGTQSGQHSSQAQDFVNVRCFISENVNLSFDTSSVFVNRGELYYKINPSDIVNVSNNNYFEVVQNSGNTIIEAENFLFEDSDLFLVKVKGKDLLTKSDNIIAQAKDILLEYTDAVLSDFDASWNTIENKNTPVESAIANIKSRIYVDEQKDALEYVLSMLEQVRVELFISKDLKIKITAFHFDEFVSNPTHKIKNFDTEINSTSLSIDERNVFNRAQAFYDLNPVVGENTKKTLVYKNQNAINQTGLTFGKKIEFPNIYNELDARNQLIEILKLSSATNEFIATVVTARNILLDIGDFVNVSIVIEGLLLENIPMLIREIGYHSDMKIILKLWSFQMINFPGWSPEYEGIVSGHDANITEE